MSSRLVKGCDPRLLYPYPQVESDQPGTLDLLELGVPHPRVATPAWMKTTGLPVPTAS